MFDRRNVIRTLCNVILSILLAGPLIAPRSCGAAPGRTSRGHAKACCSVACDCCAGAGLRSCPERQGDEPGPKQASADLGVRVQLPSPLAPSYPPFSSNKAPAAEAGSVSAFASNTLPFRPHERLLDLLCTLLV